MKARGVRPERDLARLVHTACVRASRFPSEPSRLVHNNHQNPLKEGVSILRRALRGTLTLLTPFLIRNRGPSKIDTAMSGGVVRLAVVTASPSEPM